MIGSQNFTYYSKHSYEVSFKLDRYEEGADLDEVFETLSEWWDLAGEDYEDEVEGKGIVIKKFLILYWPKLNLSQPRVQ